MARVVSINQAHTKNSREVAFNLDQPPIQGTIERVKYGVLSISFENGVLMVRLPAGAPDLSRDSITTLNAKIADAEQAILETVLAHDEELRRVSKATGLPLA